MSWLPRTSKKPVTRRLFLVASGRFRGTVFPAVVVFQIPPLTVPIHNVLAFVGCATTA